MNEGNKDLGGGKQSSEPRTERWRREGKEEQEGVKQRIRTPGFQSPFSWSSLLNRVCLGCMMDQKEIFLKPVSRYPTLSA